MQTKTPKKKKAAKKEEKPILSLREALEQGTFVHEIERAVWVNGSRVQDENGAFTTEMAPAVKDPRCMHAAVIFDMIPSALKDDKTRRRGNYIYINDWSTLRVWGYSSELNWEGSSRGGKYDVTSDMEREAEQIVLSDFPVAMKVKLLHATFKDFTDRVFRSLKNKRKDIMAHRDAEKRREIRERSQKATLEALLPKVKERVGDMAEIYFSHRYGSPDIRITNEKLLGDDYCSRIQIDAWGVTHEEVEEPQYELRGPGIKGASRQGLTTEEVLAFIDLYLAKMQAQAEFLTTLRKMERDVARRNRADKKKD